MKHLIVFGMVAALGMGAGPMSVQASIDAPQLYAKNCASCHGKDGKGQTKTGQKLNIKDLTDPEHQKSFTDEEALKSLKFGKKDGAREIKKPFASRLSDEEMEALVAFTRTFAKK
jgi:mono/diheme cytochrome c family protein